MFCVFSDRIGKRALIIITYELLYMRNVIQFWFVTNIVYVGSLFRHLGSFAHMRCRLLYFYMEAIDSDDYSVGGAAPRGREEGTDARNIESNEEIKSISFVSLKLILGIDYSKQMEESVSKLKSPITDGKIQLEGCKVLDRLSASRECLKVCGYP